MKPRDLRVLAWSVRECSAVRCVKSPQMLRVLSVRCVNESGRSRAVRSRVGPISSARRRVKCRNEPAPESGAMESCVRPCNLEFSSSSRMWSSDVFAQYDISRELCDVNRRFKVRSDDLTPMQLLRALLLSVRDLWQHCGHHSYLGGSDNLNSWPAARHCWQYNRADPSARFVAVNAKVCKLVICSYME